MATLSKITIKNYKSLADIQDFELRPLNILIGPNGSGKSNLLDFFRLLKNAANEELASTIRAEGGFSQVCWQGSHDKEALFIIWNLNLSGIDQRLSSVANGKPPTSVEYFVNLMHMNSRFTIHEERLSSGELERYNEYSLNKSDELEMFFPLDMQELAMSQIRDGISYPWLYEIRHTLDDWHIYRGYDNHTLKNLYDSQQLELVSPLRLEPDGRNLISVLYHLMTEYRDTFNELETVMAQAFPDFKSLDFPLTATGRAELRFTFKNKWRFAASQVSDGMLRFLGLATLLLMPDPPPLIAIDEPEIGLHPSLLPLLAGLMKIASGRTQLVVATHSPILISADDITLDDIVLVEMEDGKTQLSRPDSERLARWLENFTLGNLWTMGRLEAQ